MTSLQKKGKQFYWNKMCTDSFNKLKHLLTTAPILKIADPFKDFLVCTDACKEGLSRIPIQENDAVSYESRNLKDHESKYATHDL